MIIHSRAVVTLASAVLAVFGTAEASGSTITPKEARKTVDAARRGLDALIVKFPRMAEVDASIRRECAAKEPAVTADGDFCHCASAITVQLWVSGIDPQMIPRIKAFIEDPKASADGLLAYQGPELYRPICRLASAT